MSAAAPLDPYRDHMDDPEIKWKEGIPNYAVVNKLYEEDKTCNHAPDSLEAAAERLVKTNEMELMHKVDPTQWQTISDVSKFWMKSNGCRLITGEELATEGSYKGFLLNCPHFDGDAESKDSAQSLFTGAFTKGFAFEVLKVINGPPNITFTWRHWAPFTGEYKGRKGRGQVIELRGVTIGESDEQMRLKNGQHFFDTSPMFHVLTGEGGAA